MKESIFLNELTITDYFAINIFNSLMNNAGYQVIDKGKLIKEAYELAKYMATLKEQNEQKKEKTK